jgi:predicted nucleotidyltransferase
MSLPSLSVPVATEPNTRRLLAPCPAAMASNLRVFGSVATGTDKEGSDIDMLVDLRKGTSLFGLVGLQLDIEDALGVKVDLCTEGGLLPELKERILSEARPV